MLDPPVEIENPGLVAINDLTGAAQPVFQKGPVGIGLCIQILKIRLLLFRWPVEVAAGQRVLDIALEIPAGPHKPVMLRPVAGGAKDQSLFFKSSL